MFNTFLVLKKISPQLFQVSPQYGPLVLQRFVGESVIATF